MPKKQKRAESRARYYIRAEAKKRGWNVGHISAGGDFLEEQEILNAFPDIGLGLDRPDFLVCLSGEPCAVIEAKNDASKIDTALAEAIEYAETINATKKYSVKVAIGAAGEEDVGFTVLVRYLTPEGWQPLKSHRYEITNVPSKKEVEIAMRSDNGSTQVSIPSSAEFIDAAIELSALLRLAKIETPLRPKVIGAMVLAMYEGEVDINERNALRSINELVKQAIDVSEDLDVNKKKKLKDTLKLSGADFERLGPKIGRIASLLRRLNIRSVLQTDTDFLGLFYEAFLRYGYDNNALGIVFTPRHITRLCTELVGISATDRVIDIASGTGGFLVSAFDKMMQEASSPKMKEKVKQSLFGFDTNPTIWALAMLNMFFRGDGKSHIENSDCFNANNRALVKSKFTRSFLNPPFSQEGEPERDFINASLDALEPEGLLAVVVKAGIFADDDNKLWRRNLTREHKVLGVISLPDDLFYPTAAPTSILLVEAHTPQKQDDKIFMGRIWNDGFMKLKGRRVECEGSQIPEIFEKYSSFRQGKEFDSEICTVVLGSQIMDGEELSPQQWLPQPIISDDEISKATQAVIMSLYQSVAVIPDLADECLPDFMQNLDDLPNLEYNKSAPVEYFFDVLGGKSSGEKNYSDGTCAYISSGDTTNSIIRGVSYDEDEVFKEGAITVTAFGQAYIQPWPFMARGNGGSAVRVLVPKWKMSVNELAWFASQINLQRWRFFYGRMSIKSRLERLVITSPKAALEDADASLRERLIEFKESLFRLSEI